MKPMLNGIRSILIPIFIVLLTSSSMPVEVPLSIAPPIVVPPPSPNRGDLVDFMNDMAMRESNNTPTAVNRFGYMGKYQFGPTTLWGLGDEFRITREEFLQMEEMQDSAMVQLLRHNTWQLRDIIDRYNGTYRGFWITTSGILAGAHLVGPHGVRAYFDSNYKILRSNLMVTPSTLDGNGTAVGEYIRQFSGYRLTF